MLGPVPGASASTILIISNGHGEDVVGARIGAELTRGGSGHSVLAFPLVGLGACYERAGVRVVGPRRDLPSGGLLMHSLPLFLEDIRSGFLSLTLSQAAFLAGMRVQAVITVGDIYGQALSSLVRARKRFVVQTLVSARHWQGGDLTSPNRLFMERITLLERLLMRGLAHRVYVRDVETERALRSLGVRAARYLGNPVVDGLEGSAPESLMGLKTVVLLPGSRHYRVRSLERMLAAIRLLPSPAPSFAVAWTGTVPPPVPEGWAWSSASSPERGLVGELRCGATAVLVYSGRFADLLHAGRVVLGTAGTAHEQAAALARPVVTFPLPPDYSPAFIENQRRLLGNALLVAGESPAEIAAALASLLADPARAEQAGRQGQARMGPAGGSASIAADVLAAISAGSPALTKT